MKITGAGFVIGNLTNIAEKVADTSRGNMKRAADRIVIEAKANTPRDSQDLEDSIEARKYYEDDTSRLGIEIVAGEDLGDYAAQVHEDYEHVILNGGPPGPNTQAKMDQDPGRYIGSKFLDRAMDDERDALIQKMIESVTRIVNE